MVRLKDALKKYFDNIHTQEDLHIIMRAFRDNPDEATLKQMVNEQLLRKANEVNESTETNERIFKIHGNLKEIIAAEQYLQDSKPTLWYRRWYSIAATLILLGTFALLFFKKQEPKIKFSYQSVADNNIPKQEQEPQIPAKKRSVFLTLSNGKRIELNQAVDGKLASQNNIEISKTNQEELEFKTELPDAAAGQISNDKSSLAYNKLAVPKGMQFKVTLADGTKVWLNAVTELKFPSQFAGKERKVELIGEAYFEVAKNEAMPFVVITGNQAIEVLGTHFNVNGYQNESGITTTLLEGSVKILEKNSLGTVILKPGQKAVVGNEITVSAADVEESVAWKNGLTVFKDAEIESIMRQIERWYDVDVCFEGEIPKRLFTGQLPREAELSAVLKILERSKIHFKMEGKTIVVQP